MKQFYETQNPSTMARKLLKGIRQGFMILCLFIAFSSNTNATQLSGNYTIDPSGTASATVFKNFSSAINYMTSTYSRSDGGPANSGTLGVSGPVVFNVSAGTYSESLAIYSNIAGASTTNTISFIGAGRYNTIITSSGQPLSLQTSYITFSSMAFVTTSTSSNTVNANYCTYVSIINCNITAPVNANGENLEAFSDNYCTIDHDYISGGAIAVILQGYQGTSAAPYGNWTFTNNRITHYTTYGIYAYSSSTYGDFNSNISNNIIDSTINPVSYGNGILSYFQNGATIANNQVLDTVANALQMYSPNATDNSVQFKVYNNFFSNYTANCYIQFPSSTSINLLLAHNTFYNNATTYALSLYLNDNTNITVENNIFYNVSNANPAANYYNSGSFPFTSVSIDGNDYYNGASSGYLVSMNGNSYTSLSSYISAMSSYSYDQAATNVLPSIVSGSRPFNIHITPGASYPAGINAGITTDLFGVSRSSTAPTAGAVEPTPGGYLNFSGSSNYVSINNSLGNFGTGDFTIQFRFRSTSTSLQYFVSKRNICEHDNFISVDLNNGVMECETDDGTNYTGMTSGSHTYNDGNWHQYSEVRKSGTLYMYVDGNLINSNSSAANISNNYTMTLGKSVCNVGNQSNGSVIYSGDMDEMRFWSRALCISEINNNLSCELSGTQTGLLAYYKFNEGIAAGNNSSATSLTDASGNSNTGTLNNFSLSGSSSNWSDGGVSGSCSVYTSPSMAVSGIANGGSATSYGTVTTGSSASETFTITNSGDGALNINNISFSGTNAGDFNVTSSPASSVASNSSTTFTVTFTPSGSGSESAILSIEDNDLCNNNNPYNINLTGTGGCTTPSISSQPSSTAVCSGTDAVFAVTATGTDLTYQWLLSTDNGITFSNISGATSSSYTVSAPTASSNGNVYECLVTSANCASTSSTPGILTVNIAPVFTACPSNITASASSSSCGAVVNYTSTVSGIPAPSVSYSFSGATTGSGSGTGSGSTFNKGETTVNINATNTCGSAISCSFTVTVIDDIKPTASAKNITVYLDGNGAASIAASDIDNGSSDNCSVSLSIDKSSFSCANTGSNTVTLTATDPSGNSSSAQAIVNVKDTIKPTVIVKNILITLNSSNAATIDATMINNGSYDNCSVSGIAINKNSFDCSNVGVNDVTLSVTDNNGNTGTAVAKVTVKDPIAPVAKAKDITVYLDNSGQITVPGVAVNNGSSDNCSIASFTLNKSTFDCSNLGKNTVVLTVADAWGNTSTATCHITVKDTSRPAMQVKNVTIYEDNQGKAYLHVNQLNNGTTDNCGYVLAFDKDGDEYSYLNKDDTLKSFDCDDAGTSIVRVYAIDKSNNWSMAKATITILDTISPVAKAKDVTIQLGNGDDDNGKGDDDDDDNGGSSLSADKVDNGSYDNCTIVSMTLDKSKFTCADEGVNYVTLTVTDNSGNTSTATAKITVKSSLSVDAGKTQTVYYGYAPNSNATLSAKVSGGQNSYSYKWSNGATSASTTVSPSSDTKYYVAVTDHNGCSAKDSVIIQAIDVRCNQNGGSVLVCLKSTTYCLSSSSVPAYLKKGANLGSCDGYAPISENLVDQFGMTLSAYPNPFNLGTTISFTVPVTNNVNLELYNLKGEKVSTVFSGEADMNNVYTVDLKPAYLAPGVYMIRLSTPDDVKYIKLVKFE